MQVQSLRKSQSSSRLVSVGIVAAIHVAAIYALVVSLTGGIPIHITKDDIQIVDVRHPPQPPTPPVPVPHADFPMTIPGPPVPIPQIDIDNSIQHPGPAISTPAGNQQGFPPQSSYSSARAIAATHTIPDYPPVAARLNQQGDVRLALTIDERGAVTDASVVGSSGHDALDAAAIIWVKAHWRYEPALRDGKPVPSTAEAVVTFRLINRQG